MTNSLSLRKRKKKGRTCWQFREAPERIETHAEKKEKRLERETTIEKKKKGGRGKKEVQEQWSVEHERVPFAREKKKKKR